MKNLIEQNLDDFYIKCTKSPNFKSSSDDKLSWIHSLNADWPNCIFKVDFTGLDLKMEISNIKKLINRKELPNEWTIGPLTKPNNLRNLIKLDFTHEYHQSGMGLLLKNIITTNNKNQTINIIRITNELLLREWIKIVSKVFDIRIDELLIRYLFHEPETIFFLAAYQGHYVGALLLFISSNTAGLHAVSSLEEYRGKGIALEMSKAALLYAYKKGYQKAVLQASPMGYHVYKKLGFKKYCDIYSYALEI
ncbi:MAG: GNAT family N-acetyltransferase [Candidatus Hermodarchaeota archaeon]